MAHITVLAFAQARRHFGFAEQRVELPQPSTVRAVLDQLLPDWQGRLTLRVAVGVDFVPMETVLTGGEVLALIPPVSGG